MNMALPLQAAAATLFLVTTACFALDFQDGLNGSGRVVSEPRSATGFDIVAVEDEFDVTVTVGPAYAIEVTGDDNLLPFVKTQVRDRTLHIGTARDLDPTEGIRVHVTTPSLRGLSSSGSSNVRASGIRATSFDTSVSGSSDLVAAGDFGDLDSSVSGSGSIRLQGTADDIEASVSGSGELDLAQVVGRSAQVKVSGSGDVVVQVSEALDASVSGSGDVRYVGRPQVESSVSGSGSVRRVSLRS
jgi:hypothetical protein